MGLYAKFTPGEVVAAGVIFPFLGAILIALRTRARLRKVKKLAIEDYLVFVALVRISCSLNRRPGLTTLQLLMIGMGIATVVGKNKFSFVFVAEKFEYSRIDTGVAEKSEGYTTPKKPDPKQATATSVEKVSFVSFL
jgi:hypothetical protein